MADLPDYSTPPTAKLDRSQRIIWTVFIIAGLIVCAAILLAAIGIRHVGRITGAGQSELDRLRAAGEPLTPTEAAPRPVAVDQNAAPLYLQAADLLAPDKASQDALDDRMAGANWNDPAGMAGLRELVSAHQSALKLVHTAALKPYFRSDVKWDPGINASFPHYRRLRSLSRFLAVAAAVSAHDGRQAEAWGILRDGYRMSNHVSQEPCVIGQLVSYAVDAILMRSAEYCRSRGKLPAAEARKLADDLGQANFYAAMQQAIRMERAWGLQIFADPLAAQKLAEQEKPGATPAPAPQGPDAVERAAARSVMRFAFAADRAFYLRCMRQHETDAGLPWREIRAQPDRIDLERQIPKYALFSAILLPSLNRTFTKRDQALARRGLLQIVLGLEVWRQQHGEYPATLAELRNSGWPVPPDPFSGTDFVYRPVDGKYLLYSIGPDLKDDGGTPMKGLLPKPLQQKSASDAGDLGDIPWLPWRADADYSSHIDRSAGPPPGPPPPEK